MSIVLYYQTHIKIKVILNINYKIELFSSNKSIQSSTFKAEVWKLNTTFILD